jgi:MoaA/NifB/PqqE/SkfB family radical SAM enzyme
MSPLFFLEGKMLPIQPKQLLSLFRHTFDWIQVEVTSHCNALCVYCPRTVFKETWQDRHLSLETFKKLEPVLSRTDLVHLQGWGEPFLNPDFFEMVAFAKRAGCKVGTTTNAMLLNEETIRKVIESGLDILAFSLAGTKESNNIIRKGTNLKKVLKAIETLGKEKERKGIMTPEIHVAYMLFRSGMKELEALPSLLEGLGVSQVVISTLDFVPTDELRKEAVIPATEEEYREISSRLDHLVEAGRMKGLSIHYHLVSPEKRREGCTENIQKALCISSDGAVTPCVYTNLRVSGTYYDLQGEKVSYERMVFGNIHEKDVKDIWKEKSYSAFRRSFCKGELAPTCQKCPKIW